MPELSAELTRTPDELVDLFSRLRDGRDVATMLEVPCHVLTYILYRGRERYPYRSFEINKRSGEKRSINAPPPSIGILQAKLNSVLRLVYRRRPAAYGFVVGQNVVGNALNHVGKTFVLNVDLQDFFTTITFPRVRGMFMARPYSVGEKAATILAQLCCNEGVLPQGAPTSPVVSNMVCARLDGELQHVARRHRCTYSRYADDITFSTTRREFPLELADATAGWSGERLKLGSELAEVIARNWFTVNEKKKRLLPKSCRQEVTGVGVNRWPNMRRSYVRQIRAMLHAWERYGLELAQNEFRERYDKPARRKSARPTSYRRVVRGKLDYLRMVKGEADPTFRFLANWLHRLDDKAIGSYPELPSDSPDDRWWRFFQLYKDLTLYLTVERDGVQSHGTAFVWNSQTLATAAHNLDGRVQVYLQGENEPLEVTDFAFHPSGKEEIDLALVRLPVSLDIGIRFPFRLSKMNQGEMVAAIAYPTVPLHQPELGIYSGHVESSMPSYSGVEKVQVTVEMSGGMSGAPVIDRGGKLWGVAVEHSFEGTADGVPARTFRHVCPLNYLRQIHFE